MVDTEIKRQKTIQLQLTAENLNLAATQIQMCPTIVTSNFSVISF